MKPTRIQKVKGVEQNVFIQLVNEKSIALIIIFFVGVGIFMYFPDLHIGHKIGITGIFGAIIFSALSFKKEGKKLYSLVPKLISYTYRPKKFRKLSNIEFIRSNEILVFKDKIISVFSITPIDFSLLHTDEQAQFENQIRVFLNNLKEEYIQLMVTSRKATPKDYLAHFDSVDSVMNTKVTSKTQDRREKHLEGYKKNLEALIQNNIIPIREYFMLIQESCDTSDKVKLNKHIQRLSEKGDKLKRNLQRADITVNHLKQDSLEDFCLNHFQNN